MPNLQYILFLQASGWHCGEQWGADAQRIIKRQPLCPAVWPARHPPDISTEHRPNARADPFPNPNMALQATLSTRHRIKQHFVMKHKNWWRGAQWGISTCLCKHTDIPVELSQHCYIALWLESGLEFKTAMSSEWFISCYFTFVI